jgi:aminoglycoside phosphotransferase (APT) family kinase protein
MHTAIINDGGGKTEAQWERTEPFYALDRQSADRMVEQFEPKHSIEHLEPLPGGKVNSNYLLKLDGVEQRFVLRVYPEGRNETAAKEWMLWGFLRASIPMPRVFLCSMSEAAGFRPFTIQEFVEGEDLENALAHGTAISPALARSLGELLARLHGHRYTSCGFIDSNLQVVEELPSRTQWIPGFLRQYAGGRLGEEVSRGLTEFLARNEQLHRELSEEFCLVHADFKPSNIMVKDGKVQAVVDWEGTMAASGYDDLGLFIRCEEQMSAEVERHLSEAYFGCLGKNVPRNWKQKARLCDLEHLVCMMNSDVERPAKYRDLKQLIEKRISDGRG